MRSLLCFLPGLMLSAQAGEHRHFEMPIGPAGRSSTVHAYVFSAKEERLQVVAQGDGPTPLYQNLGAACEHGDAQAGVTGSVSPRGPAELPGLVISQGKSYGKADLEHPLLSGMLRVTAGGGPALRRAVAQEFAVPQVSDLLQSGPFLIEDGKPAGNLEAGRFARRCFVATDGKDRWALAYVPGATLEGLAKALSTPGTFAPFTPQTALNLAGNTASGFWARRAGGYRFYLKEISPVANYLIVVPRKASEPAKP